MFFAISSPNEGDADTAALLERGFKCGEARRCAKCGDYVGMMAWLPPYRVVLQRIGLEFGDLILLSGTNLLVSGRFRSLYRKSGMTGLSDFSRVAVVRVQTRRRNRPEMPTYYKVDVHYGGAALDLAASGCEWEHRPTCDECRLDSIKRWARIVVEERTWTGDDVFVPRGLPGRILVTERFKEFCDTNAITNAQFTPADQAGHDYYPWEKKRTLRRGTGKSKRKAK